jgi:predicted nucleic acid-binding protein
MAPHLGAVLRGWFPGLVLPHFHGRVLAVDGDVARRAAALSVPDARPFSDGLIAATALVHAKTVVTRNVQDFVGTGVAVIDPWHA